MSENNDSRQLSFIFDIDGTLCPIKNKDEKYEDIIPYIDMVEKLKYYKQNGAKIVLFTSRNMNSYNGNIGLINKNTAKVLLNWLERWDIPYDEIIYGKPWPGHKGFYVDDRTIRPDEFLNYTVEELEDICAKSREERTVNKKMTIIITMAGLGTRFKKAGYDCPKYMIKVKGKTLFEWSMDSLLNYNNHVNKYIFVVRTEEKSEGFIKEQCRRYGIENVEIIDIDYLTDGQAATCMLAIPHCNPDDAIMIYNIDTYVEPNALKYEKISCDGHIPCFHADGDHWSFVKLDEYGKAAEVREKQRISDYCSLGAYYFSSAGLYQKLYQEYYSDDKNMEQNEKYIAPLYNRMIEKGMSVSIDVIDSEKVHVLGTPEELEKFRNA